MWYKLFELSYHSNDFNAAGFQRYAIDKGKYTKDEIYLCQAGITCFFINKNLANQSTWTMKCYDVNLKKKTKNNKQIMVCTNITIEFKVVHNTTERHSVKSHERLLMHVILFWQF